MHTDLHAYHKQEENCFLQPRTVSQDQQMTVFFFFFTGKLTVISTLPQFLLFVVVCFWSWETTTGPVAYLQGTQDTSIMYSKIEERRDQESEGQRANCSIIVHWCKGGGGCTGSTINRGYKECGEMSCLRVVQWRAIWGESRSYVKVVTQEWASNRLDTLIETE